jgi:predicted transcriptional regulator
LKEASLDRSDVSGLDHALALLGPLEGRVMRSIWRDYSDQPFVVRDVQQQMPELAYTTIMTTLNRLADKGLLSVSAVPRQRAHQYAVVLTPDAFVRRCGRRQVEHIVRQFGDVALAAFAEQIEGLTPEQRERLSRLDDA